MLDWTWDWTFSLSLSLSLSLMWVASSLAFFFSVPALHYNNKQAQGELAITNRLDMDPSGLIGGIEDA